MIFKATILSELNIINDYTVIHIFASINSSVSSFSYFCFETKLIILDFLIRRILKKRHFEFEIKIKNKKNQNKLRK